MTLHTDMQAPLTEIARCRAMVAQGMSGMALAERLGAALASLEDVALRVLALEGGPVPAHWRQQRRPSFAELDTDTVVCLFEARAARRTAQAPSP
jgi:hypothetical protein